LIGSNHFVILKIHPFFLDGFNCLQKSPEDEHHDQIDDPQVYAVRADQAEQD